MLMKWSEHDTWYQILGIRDSQNKKEGHEAPKNSANVELGYGQQETAWLITRSSYVFSLTNIPEAAVLSLFSDRNKKVYRKSPTPSKT